VARILFLTSSFPRTPGDGVCGYVYDLARRLSDAHGHDVRVLAPQGGGADDEAFAPVRVERFRHLWPGARRLRADGDAGAEVASSWLARIEALPFVAAFAARAALAARDADLVCSHWLVPAGVVGAALRTRSRPHVAVAHGGDVHLLARMPQGPSVARAVARRSDRLIFVSRGLERRFAELASGAHNRSDVVPMGADLGREPAPGEAGRFRRELGAEGRPVALFLGRLVPIKGVDTLLDAAAIEPGLTVWVAGDGPELPRLRARAEAARMRVLFFGRVDRQTRRLLLDACDVVVVPSRVEAGGRAEGMPVVCAEAWAAGRPVIATAAGGMAEALEGARAGLLVPPDRPDLLASALARFFSDGLLRERLRADARGLARGATAGATAARFDRIFEELLAGRPAWATASGGARIL
jgi:glycosyltransferase involved in cell wall biosynthesis